MCDDINDLDDACTCVFWLLLAFVTRYQAIKMHLVKIVTLCLKCVLFLRKRMRLNQFVWVFRERKKNRKFFIRLWCLFSLWLFYSFKTTVAKWLVSRAFHIKSFIRCIHGFRLVENSKMYSNESALFFNPKKVKFCVAMIWKCQFWEPFSVEPNRYLRGKWNEKLIYQNPRESTLIRHFPYYPKIVLSRDSFSIFNMFNITFSLDEALKSISFSIRMLIIFWRRRKKRQRHLDDVV